MTAAPSVYPFASDVKSADMLGGKGASLARMAALGLPIPPGFTLATTAWVAQQEADGGIPAALAGEVGAALAGLERELDRRFDDPARPLLVSVRSGAPVSMPGMMDTVLNLGLSEPVVEELARRIDERFAWEIYARLLETYADIVRGIDRDDFERARDEIAALGSDRDRAAAWKALIAEHGAPFSENARDQLDEAIRAVWRSWDSPRARRYRRYRGFSDDLGTAVTVQAMVFGNLDDRSGTGVVFTRDPATGRPGAYGDFLLGAQGEDVVAGLRTPQPVESAAESVPEAFDQLREALGTLEASYRDMCDIEFTVESGRLWILQARVGQRSGPAAVRIATDMVDEGLIDIETAIDRIPVSALEELQAPVAARGQDLEVIGRGVPASPGTAVGTAVFDAARAEELAEAGQDVVLVRPDTSPRDVGGMIAAVAIVTAVGGRASHAAVVARGIGRPAVCGIDGLEVDAAAARAVLPSGEVLSEGDAVTVDGTAGTVARGAAELVPAQPDERVARLLSWCEERARVDVLESAPAGFEQVTCDDDARAAGECVLVEVPWEGADSAALLERVCETLRERDGVRLVLVVPESLRGADLRPPRGPWEAIVATPRTAWAARLLSARIPCEEAAPVDGGARIRSASARPQEAPDGPGPGVARWISAWAEIQPDRPLITFGDEHIRWGEFDERVRSLAGGLHSLGIGRGDRVACLMHNRPEFLELFFATVRLGAIFVPLNVRLAIPELEYILGDVEPALVATDERFAHVVEELRTTAVGPRWLTAGDPLPARAHSFEELRSLGAAPPGGPLPAAGDPAAILFTSGTTGRPKGAVVTHANIHYQSLNWTLSFGLTRTDRNLMFLPLCFTGGLISASMNTFQSGGSLVLAAGFDPAELLRAIERERVTWFTAVPTMVQRLFEHPDAASTVLSSLRMVESGGAPVPVPLIERARALGLELIQGYGLTEGTGGVNLYLQEWEGVRKAGSVGKPPAFGQAKVVDDSGAECAPGEIGELLIAGPLVFDGYWRNPDATAEAIVDGWLHTGDLARRDDEGFFYMAGRKKEMIITGGLNVYPVEVEGVIERFEAVAEVAVVGVPDEKWGEAVTAFVVVRPGAALREDELLRWCRGQLADYKLPKRVHVLDELPRTTSGKVLKRVLAERQAAPAA